MESCRLSGQTDLVHGMGRQCKSLGEVTLRVEGGGRKDQESGHGKRMTTVSLWTLGGGGASDLVILGADLDLNLKIHMSYSGVMCLVQNCPPPYRQ